MTPESPGTPRRAQWPLRVALGLAITALLVVGARLDSPQHAGSTGAATTTVATPTTAPSGTTTVTTAATTTVPASPGVDHPVVDASPFTPIGRGCGLHLTTSSTSTSTTSEHVALGHCNVLEIGDSLGNDLGWGLARQFETTRGLHLIQLDKSSTGLAAGWYYNWPFHLKQDLDRYHPNLMVVFLGGNDEQAIAVNGVSQPFGSAGWAAAYQARVRDIASRASHAGCFVLWVGLPIMEPAGYNRGANFLNAQYRAVMKTVPGAAFLPTWRLLATPQGTFRAGAVVNGVSSALRAPDGIHFTVVGENVLSTFVAHEISAIYHVPLTLHAPMLIDR